MTSTVLRWGILGTGRIASDFCTTLTTLSEAEHKILAVGARDLEKAKEFARKFQVVKNGSYADVLELKDIDVVYVNVMHPFHKDLVIRALNSGKHVLCEKPLGMNEKEVREMTDLAREKKLFLMEGYWTLFFPVYDELRKVLNSEPEGSVPQSTTHRQFRQVQKASASFCYKFDPSTNVTFDGAGALFGLGCYCVMLSVLLFRGAKPKKVLATASIRNVGEYKVDDDVTAILDFGEGRTFQFTCSVLVTTKSDAQIYFDDGCQVNIPLLFHTAKDIEIGDEKKHFPFLFQKPANTYIYPNGEGFAYEANCVRKCVLNGSVECPLMTLQDSETIASILDEIRSQIGLKFKADC